MAPTPRPAGWVGGSEDFEFVRTFDGRIGANPFSDDERAVDMDYRRNGRSFDQANLGGFYGATNSTESDEGEGKLDP